MNTTIKICHGHACRGNMSEYTFDRLKGELKIESDEGGASADGKFNLEKCPCQANCQRGPTMVVVRNGKEEKYSHANPVEAANILKKIGNGGRGRK